MCCAKVGTGAGLEKATAVAARYPAPAPLLAAYSACPSTREAELLLAELEVRRADSVLGGRRKVGPDVSRRIFLALTALDPAAALNK